jgi:hypothetical protein
MADTSYTLYEFDHNKIVSGEATPYKISDTKYTPVTRTSIGVAVVDGNSESTMTRTEIALSTIKPSQKVFNDLVDVTISELLYAETVPDTSYLNPVDQLTGITPIKEVVGAPAPAPVNITLNNTPGSNTGTAGGSTKPITHVKYVV